jgi:23S rRNA (guanosine2251-2'-O)-methyltransferase
VSELLYGRRAVLEALAAGRRRVYRLWLEGDGPEGAAGTEAEILAAAQEAQVPTRHVRGGIFDRLKTQNVNYQGVALETDGFPYATLRDILGKARTSREPALLLLLDQVQDPQNLGTLIRTAEAMAVHGAIIPERRSASVTPAVSNASAGAVEHLLVAQVTNLNRTIDQLKEDGVWVTGLEQTESAVPLHQADLSGPLALVVGSEGKGLSRLTREKCDFTVYLPMYGKVESLNAAVAGSIVLHAVRAERTRRSQSSG